MAVQNAVSVHSPRWYHRTQPFRTLYIVYFAVTLLASLPLVVVKSIIAPPKKGWSLKKWINVYIMRQAGLLMGRVDLRLGRDLSKDPPESKLKQSRLTHAPPVGQDKITGFLRECMEQAGVKTASVPIFWYMHPSQLKSWTPKPSPGEKVLLDAGGGGFCAGNAAEGDLCAYASEILVSSSTARVVSIDYRNAHNGGVFPGAVLDVLSAYAYLLDLGYEAKNICVGGQSAGGAIWHQAIRYLVETRILPLPRGVFFSGVTWTWTDDGSVSEENLPLDWIDPSVLPHFRSVVTEGLPASVIKTPYWSPVRKEMSNKEASTVFKGFPPTFLQVGGSEILLAQNLEAKKAFEASGVKLTFNLEPEAVHDPLICTWQGDERKRIAKAIVEWNEAL